MPMSTDVSLPRGSEPIFPSCCCRCLAPDAEQTVRFSASRFSWWQVFFVWIWWFRKAVRHEVPCCAECCPSIRRRKWLELIVYASLLVVSLAVVMPWLKSMGASRQWQKIGVFGGAMVFGVPFFVWTVVRPPAFDMTVGDEHVEYEFANADYARMFADGNPGYCSEDLGSEDEFDDEDDDELEDVEASSELG